MVSEECSRHQPGAGAHPQQRALRRETAFCHQRASRLGKILCVVKPFGRIHSSGSFSSITSLCACVVSIPVGKWGIWEQQWGLGLGRGNRACGCPGCLCSPGDGGASFGAALRELQGCSALLSKFLPSCQVTSSTNPSSGTNLLKFPVPAMDHGRTCYSLCFWLLLRTHFSGDVSFMVLKLSFQG